MIRMVTEPTDVRNDPVYGEAASWLTRLQDPNLSFEESLDWQRWLSEDPKHREAFERLEQVWDQPWEVLKGRSRKLVRSREWRSPMRWAAAASVLIGLIAVVAFLSLSSRGVNYQTQVGENRSVSLSDGTRVMLGGDSEFQEHFSRAARLVELKRGEAFFKVARNPGRPFSVRAGRTLVTAVGTEFNVRRGSDRVVVAVVEGRVLLQEAPLPKSIAWVTSSAERPPAPLAAGEEAIVEGSRIQPTRHVIDEAAATGWQRGQLAFRQEPLRYAIEDVNRYAKKPIVLGSADIGDIRITGTVLGGSIDGWIEGLESGLKLQARETEASIVLERFQQPQQ